MEVKWVEGYEIRVTIDNGAAVIKANREGLLSLATQLAMMATEASGTHIHYCNEHRNPIDYSNIINHGTTKGKLCLKKAPTKGKPLVGMLSPVSESEADDPVGNLLKETVESDGSPAMKDAERRSFLG